MKFFVYFTLMFLPLKLLAVKSVVQPTCEKISSTDVAEQVKQLKIIGEFSNQSGVVQSDDQWVLTNFGFKIDRSCLQTYGNKFPDWAQKSIGNGLICLQGLNSKSSQKNAAKLNEIIQNKNNPPKIKCEAFVGSDNATTMARATANPGDVDFPQITINTSSKFNEEEAKASFFHEFIHTAGYQHSADIEFMYACPDCCAQPEKTGAACNICRGDYKNLNDPKYYEDVMQWGKDTDGRGAAARTILSGALSNLKQVKIRIKQFKQVVFAKKTMNDFKIISDSELNSTSKDLLKSSLEYPALAERTKDLIKALSAAEKNDQTSALKILQLRKLKKINTFGLTNEKQIEQSRVSGYLDIMANELEKQLDPKIKKDAPVE